MEAHTTPVYPPLGVVGDCSVVVSAGCGTLLPVVGTDFITEEAGTAGLTFVTCIASRLCCGNILRHSKKIVNLKK